MLSGYGEFLIEIGVTELVVHTVVGKRVGEGEAYFARGLFVGHIGDLHSELELIALAQEARRVGLHHDVLGGNRAAAEEAATQFVIVCEAHKLPLGECLRHREFQSHFAFFIGHNVRQEEGGFVEVLAGGNLIEVWA